MGKQKGKHFTPKNKKEKRDKKKQNIEEIEKIEESKVETIEVEKKPEKKKSKHKVLKGFLIILILGLLIVGRWVCLSNKRRIHIRKWKRNNRQNKKCNQ